MNQIFTYNCMIFHQNAHLETLEKPEVKRSPGPVLRCRWRKTHIFFQEREKEVNFNEVSTYWKVTELTTQGHLIRMKLLELLVHS